MAPKWRLEDLRSWQQADGERDVPGWLAQSRAEFAFRRIEGGAPMAVAAPQLGTTEDSRVGDQALQTFGDGT